MPKFPSMSQRELLRVLEVELGYRVDRQSGSHMRMKSDQGWGPLTFAFHPGVEIPPFLVRKILVKDAGLSEEEAIRLVR